MKVHTMISNRFEIESEEKMFYHISHLLKDCPFDEEVWLIGNINLFTHQIDALLIKNNNLIIIEMKDWKGSVKGTENGDWTVTLDNGTEKATQKNFFKQVRDQHYELGDYLKSWIEKQGKLKTYLTKPWIFKINSVFLCFQNSSTFKDVIISDREKWFYIVTPDEICHNVQRANPNRYKLKRKDINEIIDIFNAKIVNIEEEYQRKVQLIYNNIKDDIYIRSYERGEEKYETPVYERFFIVRKQLCDIKKKTTNKRLKLYCDHLIALTLERFENTLMELIKLYNNGYHDNDISKDILLNFFKLTDVDEIIKEKVESIRDEMIENRKYEALKEVMYSIYEDDNYDNYNSLVAGKIGATLLYDELYPDDSKILYALYWLFIHQGDVDIPKEILVPLIIENDNITEWLDLFIFNPLEYSAGELHDLFINIKEKYPEQKHIVYYYYALTLIECVQFTEEIETVVLDGVREILNKSIDFKNNYLPALRLHAQISLNRGDINESLRIIERLVEIKEKEPVDYLLIIETYRERGRDIDDFSNLNQFLDKYECEIPYNDVIYYNLGEYYLNERNFFKKGKEYIIKILNQSIYTIKEKKSKESNIPLTSQLFNTEGVRGISIDDIESRYSLSETEMIKRQYFSFYGKKALDTLINYYLKHEKLHEAFEILEKYRKNNIYGITNNYSHVYQSFAVLLLNKHKNSLSNRIINDLANLSNSTNEITEENRKKELEKTQLTLDNYYCNNRLKRQLIRIIKRLKKGKPESVLLYGPPGCGKTYLVKAIAGELNFHLDIIKCSDILSKWAGDTEKNINKYFKKAKEEGNWILFFDEFEAIGTKRTELLPHERKVSAQLLKEFEEILEINKRNLIVTATNHRELLDPAITRTGRIQRKILITPPDAEGIKNIYKLELEKFINENPEYSLSKDIDYDILSNECMPLTGADINQIIDTHLYEVLEEINEQKSEKIEKIDTSQILGAISLWKEDNMPSKRNIDENKNIKGYI